MDGVTRVAVALGSNVGDREATLRGAVDALASFISAIRVSTLHETNYVGEDVQPPVLNGALAGETTVPPHALLERLLQVELEFGRTRPYGGAPRTLDLDLILYGEQVIDEPGLVVPHPRFRERLFVLEPLAEVAGEWRDPVTGKTVFELLRALRE